MTILIPIVDIRLAMIAEIALGAVYAIVKATTLDIIPGIRRPVPTTILPITLGRRPLNRSVHTRCRKKQKSRESEKSCNTDPIEIHLANSPFKPVSGSSAELRTQCYSGMP
jgi:hypothetical protein